MSQDRREKLVDLLQKNLEPLSGRKLGQILQVSRQVIVQDVALLRAQGLDVVATARGYVLHKNTRQNKQRVILVQHHFDDIEDELNTIIDFGATIRNVIVEHAIYGEIVGNMMIETRRDVKQFIADIQRDDTYPLMKLTFGIHRHTIEAESEKILDEIELALNQKGYLYTGP